MLIPLISDLTAADRAANLAYLAGLQPPLTPVRPITRATVLGGAATGLGVALSMAVAGISVLFLEEDASSQERAEYYLKRLTGGAPALAQAATRVAFSTNPADARPSDLVIDRTIEPIAHKARLLQQVAQALPPDTPLLTNLAGPQLDRIAGHIPAPHRLLGAQVFAPAADSRIVELAVPPHSAPQALATARAWVAQIGKTPVLATASGFTSDRLMLRLGQAAEYLLMHGSTPWDVDEALIPLGYAMGPFESQDLIGTDVAYALRRQHPGPTLLICDRAVEEGRLGKKASVGWYRYPGGEGKVIDPLVEDLCREEAWFAGITPRPIGPAEIRSHLVLALINAAAQALSDGIPASDLDLLSVHAAGFPADWGGILRYADRLGAAQILAALTRLQDRDGSFWGPAPALRACARSGTALRDWQG